MSVIQDAALRDPILFPGETSPPSRGNVENVPQFPDVPLDQLTKAGFLGIDLTIQKSQPSIIFDALTAGDTDYWIGNINDAGGTANDALMMGKGLTPGTTPFVAFNYNAAHTWYTQTVSGNFAHYWHKSGTFGGTPDTYNSIQIGQTGTVHTFILNGRVNPPTGPRAFLSWSQDTSSATSAYVALAADGNMSILFGSGTKILTAATGEVQFTTSAYMGPSRTFNFAKNVTTSLRALGYSSDAILVGDTAATSTLSLFAGSATSRLDIATDGTITAKNKLLVSGELEVDGDINHDGTNVGFYGVTPVARPTAYTQNYTTTTRTIDAYTTDTESVAYTGIDNAQAGTVYATVADLNALRTAYENLRVSYDNLISAYTQTLDDLQAVGLLQ